MTALAAGKTRYTPSQWKRMPSATLTSGKIAYTGGSAAIVVGTGKFVPATGSAKEIVVGKFTKDVDASSADKPCIVEFDQEKTLSVFVNGTSGDAIAAANVGSVVYALDDQTATIVPNASPLGIFWGFDVNLNVLVELFGAVDAPGTGAIKGATLAFASNDIVVTAAQALNGVTFDVPTTAAASTVTLPVTGVADGTTVCFVADGTKNGHTVQYRFGTTNITAALTASKIHMVTATKLGSGWGAVSGVSP